MCALTECTIFITKNRPEDGSLELKHVANYVLIDYTYAVYE